MKKRLVASLAVILAAALVLAGCGGGGLGGNSTLGRYEGYATTVFGENTAFDETYTEGENYVELKDDGVAVLCLDGSPTEGTYTLDGENITITIGDEESSETYDSTGTVKDGVLTIDFLGIGIEFTFVKDGVEPPFALTDTSTSANDTTTDEEETTEETTTEDTEGESDDSTSSEGTADAETTDTTSDGEANE